MANFYTAIPWVLDHEGGYVDHPHDPGGATNYGISLRFLQQLDDSLQYDYDGDGDVDADDIKALTKEDAKTLYRRNFWNPFYNSMRSQPLATKLLDMGVNMGSKQAVRLLQRAVSKHVDIVIDGLFGPQTLGIINNDIRGTLVLQDLIAEQAKFYFQLVDKRPARGVFLLGWLRRAYAQPPSDVV